MIAGSGHLRPSSCDVARGGQEEKTNRFRKSSLAVYRANADGRRLMAGEHPGPKGATNLCNHSEFIQHSIRQSVSQPVNRFQMAGCSSQEKQSCFQPVECAPAWCFWLFIQVRRKSEGTQHFFFSVWLWEGRLLPLTVC